MEYEIFLTLNQDQVEILLHALEVYALDMHNASVVCGDIASEQSGEVADCLIDQISQLVAKQEEVIDSYQELLFEPEDAQ